MSLFYSAGLTAIPDSGIARYKFEQDVTDSWNNNDGIDNTSAGYTTDAAVGTYAKSFDGTDDFVDTTLGDATVIGLDAITVTAWLKQSSGGAYLSNSSQNNASILLRDSGGAPQWGFYTDADGYNGGPTGNALSLDTWEFVAGVYSLNDGGWRIHQGADATQTNSGTHSGSIARQGSTAYRVKVGTDGASDGRFFGGDIDDPRLYGSALSQSQLQTVASGDLI